MKRISSNVGALGVCMLLMIGMAVGQVRLQGTVQDLEGSPVQATIRFKGGSKLVVNGQFDLVIHRVPDTVRFTALGFSDVTRVVTGEQTLHIRMTPSNEFLEEVVVHTGYQVLLPHEVNGTIALIGEKELQHRIGGTILDRIKGHASGLARAVDKTASKTGIMVRGLGTINGPIDPLIVLDGYIYDGDIDNINPDDVESVSILKDAAAVSIWGARAGNGVIVITSKKGRYNQKMRVSFQSDHGFRGLPDLEPNTRIGASEHIALETFLFEQGYFDNIISSRPYNPLSPIVTLLHRHRQGELTVQELESELDFWRVQDARQNYLDEFYTRSWDQRYALQFNGGGERNHYLLSGSYNHSLGTNHSTNSRFNLRLNNEFRITERLRLSVNAQVLREERELGRATYGTFKPGGRIGDYMAFRDKNGEPIAVDNKYRGSFLSQIEEPLLDWQFYPADNYKHIRNGHSKQEAFATMGLQYQLFRFLDLSAGFQYQVQHRLEERLQGEDSYEARDLVNQYTQVNLATGTVSYVVPPGGVHFSREYWVNSFTWRGQANFREQFGGHRIHAMIGTEFKGSGTSMNPFGYRYGYQEDPLTATAVDLMTRYPHFITGSSTRLGSSVNMTKTTYRFVSLYGNVAYHYMGRYLLTGSMRRDGSNVFGAHVNDRWKPLWSAGIGWDISQESFYESKFVPHLKFTMTYGTSGNVDMSKTALPLISYGSNSDVPFRFARVVSINNPELRWEQQSQLAIRMDLSTRGDRIKGSVNAFKKYGSDLYGNAPYDFTAWGVSSAIVRNVANMEGYGVELDLHTTNYKSRHFEWRNTLYFNWNDNRTTAYHENPLFSAAYYMVTGSGTTRVNPVVGKPLHSIAAYRWAGLDEQGDPQGYVGGAESADYQSVLQEARDSGGNIRYFGSGSPRFYGSLSNQFTYGSVELMFGLGFRMGYFMRKNSVMYGSVVSSGDVHMDYLQRWQYPGDELHTDIPRFVYPSNSNRDSFYMGAEPNVIPGDQIRLDYVRLFYHMNTSQWRHPFRSLGFSCGMENGGILWVKNKHSIDPDYQNGNGSQPLWSLGVKLQF